MSSEWKTLRNCGGCRLGCSTARLQCARGEMLLAARCEERANPEPGSSGAGAAAARSGGGAPGANPGNANPGGAGPCEYRLSLSAAAQLARVIGLIAREVDRRVERLGANGPLLLTLANHGGRMSLRAIAAHEHLSATERDAALAALGDAGLVSIDGEGQMAPSASLSPEGWESAREWRQSFDELCDQVAEPLSDDERQLVVTLLFRVYKTLK